MESESAAPISEAAQAPTAAVGFAKRTNRANIRKRADELEPEDVNDTNVVKKAKQSRGEPLAFSTKADKKETSGVQYEGSRAIQSGKDELVTRTAIPEEATAKEDRPDKASLDGTYQGLNNYVDYRQAFRREGTEKGPSHGPLRSSQYMRVTARFDYQPDICKDYKETGFCSYGDSCKFLHDRGDYKSGWELEREWEAEQKRKLDALAKGWNPDQDNDEVEEDQEDDGLPFACYICRKPWEECTTPVVTRCKHYFCESCALKRLGKAAKCAVCEQPTLGIFNEASDIIKKLKKQQAQ